MHPILRIVYGLIVVAAGALLPSQLQAATLRRDISRLTTDELREYRDAWRAFQAGGAFAKLAGHHGCPDYFCHNDYRIFLPWHRAYTLKVEKALQAINPSSALHYWDWTSNESIQQGIPRAFTDQEYQSGGSTYPNPLWRFRFQCAGTSEFTRRFPRPPSELSDLLDRVNYAYTLRSYEEFNSTLDGPHGDLHGWVGGHMGSTTYAAYDPIFFAHHSNVDRQWAHWQGSSNNADPSASIQSLPLEPFGTTVKGVLNYRALGYEYDRLRTEASQPQLVSADGTATFADFELPAMNAHVALFVHDLPVHPPKSFRIFVFVNQTAATIEDARADNPKFAGFFAIFGGSHGANHAQGQPAEMTRTRRVMDLTLAIRRAAAENKEAENKEAENKELDKQDVTITLVATDVEGQSVKVSDLPFNRVSIQRDDALRKD
ncbi:MAG: tyrosinase family protein [Pirellulales bacterium]